MLYLVPMWGKKWNQTDLTLTLDTETVLSSPLSLINPSISLLSGSGVSPKHGGTTPRHLAATTSPACPASRSLTTMVLVGLGLALGALGLGVGRARRVWLLHRHGPSQVGALTQEVRLRREAEGTFPQDHANRGGLLGPGSVSELKRGEVRCVAVTQELHEPSREQQEDQRYIKGNDKLNE